MTESIYKITPRLYERLKSRGIEFTCFKCGEKLKVGDTVKSIHRKRTSIGCNTKIYHLACWHSTFY